MSGFTTLLYKEVLRFWKVSVQTVGAPGALGAPLSPCLRARACRARAGFPRRELRGVPGSRPRDDVDAAERIREQLLFAHPVEGHGQYHLHPAAARSRPFELFLAYLLAAIVRALVVGAGVFIATVWIVPLPIAHPLWVPRLRRSWAPGCSPRWVSSPGVWAEKFDQIAAFQNFIVMPLTFLAGVFYSVHSLPPFWQGVSRLNPFFYAVDGFRYGFFGQSDIAPWTSLAIATAAFAALSCFTLFLSSAATSCVTYVASKHRGDK
jgi:ABC-2 type transport system permease protein